MLIFDENKYVKDPAVSVVVITYNQEKYIEQCVNSILEQIVSFPYELIISDDHSTDATSKICLQLQKRYPEIIKLNIQDKNVGLIDNYTDVISLCKGSYIAQIAGDDFWIYSKKLQDQYDLLESDKSVGLCYTNTLTCAENGSINNTALLDKSNLPHSFMQQLYKAAYISPNSWMYRRDMFNDFVELQPWFTDESLAVALDFFYNSKVYYMDRITSVYRVHTNSLATQLDSYKRWKYEYGVCMMQLHYAMKYNVSDDAILKLKIQNYISLVSKAIEASQSEFIKETIEFFREHDMELCFFVDEEKRHISYMHSYNNILNSYAYRVGKLIVKPFSFLRKLLGR